MFFVPEKGRMYRWAVHIKPLYRYAGTMCCVLGLIGACFFLLNPWLTSLVQYEHAMLNRAQQQIVEACIIERSIKAADLHLATIQHEMGIIKHNMVHQDQFASVCDAAQKAGVQIIAFAHEKQKQKEWRTKSCKSLSATGTLDQSMRFLSELAHKSHMIQCKQLALQRADQGLFSLQAQLEFIALQG